MLHCQGGSATCWARVANRSPRCERDPAAKWSNYPGRQQGGEVGAVQVMPVGFVNEEHCISKNTPILLSINKITYALLSTMFTPIPWC